MNENGRRQDLQRLPLRKKKAERRPPQVVERRSRPMVLENKAFEEYYRAQGIVEPGEFDVFLRKLREPLPSVFRITEASRFFEYVRHTVEQEIESFVEHDRANNVSIASRLPWYRGQCAYKLAAPRSVIRNDPNLSRLHRFLILHNRLGSINRQEEVSMIPVQLLDVHSGQKVIDLCASPGSKTAQIMDAMAGTASDDTHSGLLVANDSDLKRCWMLIHQLKRFSSPELIITNHEGQSFPPVVEFDRVLCDVPCSGDGTLRKLPDLWRKWTAESCIPLHRLQVEIAWHGINLLRPGGRMVYSTCSLNPLENEAVVAEILRRGGDHLRLIDSADMLPGLKSRRGLTTWKVKDTSPNGGWFGGYDELKPKRRKKITRSMFPPEDASAADELKKSMRLVPHDQDCGGFYVAIIERRKEAVALPVQQRDSVDPDGLEQLKTNTKDELWGGGKLIANDPLLELVDHEDKNVASMISDAYGIDPEVVRRNFMYRASDRDKVRKVYYAADSVCEVLKSSLGREEEGTVSLRTVYAGVRVIDFAPREGVSCPYRLTFEGINVLLPYMTRQKVPQDLEDYKLLLSDRTLPLNRFKNSNTNLQVEQCDRGTIAFVCTESHSERDAIVALKGFEKLTPLVPLEMLNTIRMSLELPAAEVQGDDGQGGLSGGNDGTPDSEAE
mmetsp:Transcript_2462/g.7345  ORF Transcript_2462/g.7345 Transcript_2462/m.7345 type:complete len:670 (-) Transcript_2462:1598-3607(-)